MVENQGLAIRKTALAVAISGVLWSPVSYAQAQQDKVAASSSGGVLLEEVIVYGVRASQAKAIDIKRDSANIVDSIVAEDIGKLPDTTITDSLQRITGVQIKREANEGTSLNVRGMPQVLTTLNGEQFLSPWNITSVGANYADVPAAMISGVDVYKSVSPSILAGGISGVVDLKTFRPLNLEEGFTGKVKVELSQGSRSDQEIKSDGTTETRSPDHNINAFVAQNWDGKYGVALGIFHNEAYAANYQMYEDQRLAFLDGRGGAPTDPLDLNGDSDLVNDWYLVPQEFGARSNFMERERQGGSLSIEAVVSDHVKVRGDVFYTRMDQHDRGVKAAFNGRSSPLAYAEEGRYLVDGEVVYIPDPANVPAGAQDWSSAQEDEELYNVLLPGSVVGHGADITYIDRSGNPQTRSLHTLRVANILAPDFQASSTSQINRTAALNTNFEIEYSNLQNFDANLRFVYAEAQKQHRNAQLNQGTPAWLWVDANNAGGKDPLKKYNVTVDYRGEIPSFSFDADLSSPDFLEQYQGFANGENSEASLGVVRADAQYQFDALGIFESIDFGVRYAVRDADHAKFYYVAPTARYSNWDDPRVSTDKRFQLRSGNEIWQIYPEWRRFDIADEDQRLITVGGLEDNGFNRDATMAFTDFGPIRGFENGVSALNPAAWDNPLDFMNRLYPGTRTAFDPGETYSVEESTLSWFGQLNFRDDIGLFNTLPYSGNVGLRVVETDRTVVQTNVPEVLDRFNSIGYDDWQRIAFVSSTSVAKHSFSDVLPSFNLNVFPHDDVVVRFGASRTMSRNDLRNVGSGMVLWYQQCAQTDENGERVVVEDTNGNEIQETVSCVGGGSDQGNPRIAPWRANVFNTSAEWYFAENAILGAGIFMIDIQSSVQTFQEQRSFVDGDGIDRNRTANVWVAENVSGQELAGFEVGYKQPFTFFDNDILAATGIEFNYTYSDSDSSDLDVEGKAFPLQSNSEHQSNFILWYDKSGLNVRLAYNWRSKEYLGRVGLNTNEAPLDLGNWLEPTGYLDLSVNYWVNEHFSFYFSGTNLTEQHRVSYSQFKEQFHSLWIQERRFAAGVTVSF